MSVPQKPELELSVHAALFRAAQGFSDQTQEAFASVRIEPIRTGGVVMIGAGHDDMLAVFDPSGRANRSANIVAPKAMLNLAVDMFRREGVETRLRASRGLLAIEPDSTGQAARNFERDHPFLEWRKVLARQAIVPIQPPFRFNAAMGRKLADAARGLARAGDGCDDFELLGGKDATLAQFPGWRDAVAVFAHPPGWEEFDRSTMWHPQPWIDAPRLALVES